MFGIGRTNTLEAFRKACKRLIFVENLLGDGEALRDADGSGPGDPVGDGPKAKESTAPRVAGKPAQQAPPTAPDKAEAVEAVQKQPPTKAVPLISAYPWIRFMKASKRGTVNAAYPYFGL